MSTSASPPEPRNPKDLLALTPSEFEDAVAELLKAEGYRDVKRVGGSGDLGVDIFCRDATGSRIAVQCKRYAPGRKISVSLIQMFFGMIVHHGAERGIYITTSSYTGAARNLARDRDIDLIDGAELDRRYRSLPETGTKRGIDDQRRKDERREQLVRRAKYLIDNRLKGTEQLAAIEARLRKMADEEQEAIAQTPPSFATITAGPELETITMPSDSPVADPAVVVDPLEAAAFWLWDALAAGPRPGREICEAARLAGHDLDTIHRARLELEIRTLPGMRWARGDHGTT